MGIKEDNLHPGLRDRWEKAKALWGQAHPDGPVVFLDCTYRSPQEQNALYAKGRTRPGLRVTNAQAGQSLHNYYPARAFDIAFKKANGALDWNEKLFREFSKLAKPLGLEWGGDWKSFCDMPHFNAPGDTWQKARDGLAIAFPGEAPAAAAPKPANGARPSLGYGDTGEAVKELQSLLAECGFFDGDYVTGNFLDMTEAAVLDFQGACREVKADFPETNGQVGPATWAALIKTAQSPEQ